MWVIRIIKKENGEKSPLTFFCHFTARHGICFLECAGTRRNPHIKFYKTKESALRDAYYFKRCGWCVQRVFIECYIDGLQNGFSMEEVFLNYEKEMQLSGGIEYSDTKTAGDILRGKAQ